MEEGAGLMNEHGHKITLMIDMGSVSERVLERLDQYMSDLSNQTGVRIEGWEL